MSRQGFPAAIVGGAALLGGGLYFARKPASTGDPAQQTHGDKSRPTADEVEAKKERANAKRDLGMGGAGVGGNHVTGGTELGSGLRSGNTENPNRERQQGPTDKMPSDAGAIGGGPGRANSNTRAIETHGPSMSPSSANPGTGGENKSGGGSGGSGGSTNNSSNNNNSSNSSSNNNSDSYKKQGTSGDSHGNTSGSNTSGGGSGFSEKLHGLFGGQGERPRQAPVDTKVASHMSDTPTNRGGSPWDKHRKDVTAVSKTES
ncbi:hypothetical protein Cob_v013162 [Colletotrichum orbiculare MAFF 240422]|uniref:Uncharacterized protein n=1 Tax=Colletotrichum orbiculare (strain 104-T / ATCC 96160 / CBS 514.97 / LARS 414 / MAFF 240422) TaxID=1213857 RepID=N4VY05_COLOR|nr:hypothetical protein Cob_v013162 [Colletotrichum orbiculare MAFF 240422]